MAEKQETIADIIADMRDEGHTGESSCLEWVGAKMRYYADRLEAAIRRESGDCAKLREALKLCVDEMCNRCRDQAAARGDTMPCLSGCEPVRKAIAALAAPPRNSDVGTVEEQGKRFTEFCYKNRNVGRCCGDCPAFNRGGFAECELAWTQMPYEEGGAK